MGHKQQRPFEPLNIAILTISDTRNRDNDTSGDYLDNAARQAGHQVVERTIVKDDIYELRAVVSQWIASPSVQVVLATGGTGFTARDNTPEALQPLFDRDIPGFGELFRQISYADIGTSTVQSRAIAGLANGTLIFAMPGSPNACKVAFEKIIQEQLDASHRPCNFVPHLKATASEQCTTRGDRA